MQGYMRDYRKLPESLYEVFKKFYNIMETKLPFKIYLLDMFSNTFHFETLVILKKNN